MRIFRKLAQLLDVDTTGVADGDALVYDDAGGKWVPGAGGGGSGSDDQTAAEVPFTPAGNIAATNVQTAVEELDTEKAAATHAHAGEDITSGTVADARIASTIARDSEVTSAISALSTVYQPLDSDLTAVAALTTTSFGRGLLELANAAALLSAAGAAAAVHAHAGEDITSGTVADARIASTIARDSEVTSAISALSTVYQPLDSDLTAIAALTTTSFGRAFLAFADEAAFKAGVNLEAGTDFPALTTFNDHSARHENGGADEISLAGLDGTPADLQTHLDDTSAAHAASAISFSPTGTVAATDVQAAIAEVASEATGIPATLFDAKGDLIAASAADTAARVAVGVDGAMLYADSAATAGVRWMNDPVRQTFGAPDTAFEFNTSSLSGLTALGTPTTENADTTVAGALYLAQAAGTINIVGRYVAASTPFTAITYLKAFAGFTQFNAAGLIIGASTPGALATYGPRLTGGHAASISAVSWTGPTGTGTGIAAGMSPLGFIPVYLMLVANSSDDVDFYVSFNGFAWTRFHLNYNPSFTVGAVGVGIQAESASSTAVSAAFDYLRIWNSALTVPGSP